MSFRIILSDLECLSEIFNETKHRAVSLRQLSCLQLPSVILLRHTETVSKSKERW